MKKFIFVKKPKKKSSISPADNTDSISYTLLLSSHPYNERFQNLQVFRIENLTLFKMEFPCTFEEAEIKIK